MSKVIKWQILIEGLKLSKNATKHQRTYLSAKYTYECDSVRRERVRKDVLKGRMGGCVERGRMGVLRGCVEREDGCVEREDGRVC